MVLLPNSGHACLVESDINLYEIMQKEHFLDSSAVEVATSNSIG